jgi:hypothetical protein
MRLMVVIAALLATSAASAQEYSCDQVRQYVRQVGLEQARRDARAQGMTRDQERRAANCLKRGR